MPRTFGLPTELASRTCLFKFSSVKTSGSTRVSFPMPILANSSATALPPEPQPTTAADLSFKLDAHSFSIWFLLRKIHRIKSESPSSQNHSGDKLVVLFQDFFYCP